MLYSVNNSKLIDADEIRCESNQLGLIIKDIGTRRVNIHFNKKDSFDTLLDEIRKLDNVTKNYTVSCDKFTDLIGLLEAGIPAFFNFPVTDWETFSSLIEYGISDIIIDGPLGFQMDFIAKNKNNTLIRVCPHISTNAALTKMNGEATFFIRPEDTKLYEEYIDIFEIKGNNKEQEEVIFNIYRREYFNNDLSILIKHLKSEAFNPIVPEEFAEKRLNCGQRCKYRIKCRACALQLELAEKIKDYYMKNYKDKLDLIN